MNEPKELIPLNSLLLKTLQSVFMTWKLIVCTEALRAATAMMSVELVFMRALGLRGEPLMVPILAWLIEATMNALRLMADQARAIATRNGET